MKAPVGNLTDRLAVWGFDGDFAIFTDGSLGFGLALTPLDITASSNSDINGLSEKIRIFLNGLEPGLDIQFVQDVIGGNDALIESNSALRDPTALPLALDLCTSRNERWKELDREGIIPRHVLYAFVRRPMSTPLLKGGFFRRAKLFPEIAASRLQTEIGYVDKLRSDLKERFTFCGLQPQNLGCDETVDLVYRQWNPLRPVDRTKGYDPEDVRPHLVFTDAFLYDSGFSLGAMHYRVISIKLLPEQTYASMSSCLRNLPFDSRLQLSIHVCDQQKEIEHLKTQRRLTYSLAYGGKGLRDVEGQAKHEDIEQLLEGLIAQGEKVFQVSLNIILRSKSEDELSSQVSQTLATLRDLGGAEGMEEGLIAFEIFSQVALPNVRAKERVRRMKTSNLADLIPIFGPWKGHESASLLLQSSSGNLIPFDPFSSELTNANQIISGGSGSGKSFLANALILQLLKENIRGFIVDVGASYKKLCENLGGQYVSLALDSDFSLNPFELGAGQVGPDSQKVKFILGLVDLMSREVGEVRLPKLERAEIEEAIQQVFSAQDRPPSLSALQARLLEHSNIEIRRIGRILGPWCGENAYGRFFDRPTRADLRERLVCFDLKGLEDHPELQSVFLYMITALVWREVQQDRDNKKLLVMDECWRLLESEAGSGFIGEVFRTFRKYRASAVAISQNIDDFAQSPVAKAILSNSSVRWILSQKGADPDRLSKVLGLNDNELRLIQELRKKHGVYSEAFLIAGDHRSTVALSVTPLEYWIATSDPNDATLFRSVQEKNPELSRKELLNFLAEKYPRGAVTEVLE